jgi:hypothetical protein
VVTGLLLILFYYFFFIFYGSGLCWRSDLMGVYAGLVLIYRMVTPRIAACL